MTIDDDDQLLDRLAQALAADMEHLPTDEEVATFRAVVASDSPPTAGRVIPFERPVRRIARRVAFSGAAAVVGLSAATAVGAAANDGVLPEPARVVAHAVGLPVDSVELASAKDALRRLRHADDQHLESALDHAQKALADLSNGERRDIIEQADQDLRAAEDRLSHGGHGGDDGGSSGSGPAPTNVGSSGDDHGGTSGPSGGSSGDGHGSGDSSTQVTGGDNHGGSGDDQSGSGSGSGTVAPAPTVGSGSGGGPGSGGNDGDDANPVSVATTGTSKSGGDDHQTVASTVVSAPTVSSASTSSTAKSEDGHGGGSGGGGGGSGSDGGGSGGGGNGH